MVRVRVRAYPKETKSVRGYTILPSLVDKSHSIHDSEPTLKYRQRRLGVRRSKTSTPSTPNLVTPPLTVSPSDSGPPRYLYMCPVVPTGVVRRDLLEDHRVPRVTMSPV